MPQFNHPLFQRLAQSLDAGVTATGPRSFDLVFDDDLTVTAWLHPDDADVGVDLWIYDAALLTGATRRAVVNTLLLLNHEVRAGQPFCIGLDSRDFVLVHGREAMDRLEGMAFGVWLVWLVEQARRVRELIRTLTLEEGRLSFTLSAPTQGEP